jgi:hypothetical protein
LNGFRTALELEVYTKMADLAYRNDDVTVMRGRTNWPAIWTGVFTFMAIWLVFGALGVAIFASASPAATYSLASMGVGIGIWTIVLTVIAMYVAGLETARLAAINDRHDSLIHGMAIFGLSAVAVIILAVLAKAGFATVGSAAPGSQISASLGVSADLGWASFASLFLGWLAALLGAASAAPHKAALNSVRDIRPAA